MFIKLLYKFNMNEFIAPKGKVFIRDNILYGDVLILGKRLLEDNTEIEESINDYYLIDEPDDYELGKQYKNKL